MNYGRTTKTIASLLLILLLHEIVLPIWLPLYATTQPESFGSSGSSEYVDPFTGQFKYSIPVITVPGPNGSDYTLDLSYNSGIKPEEEASWVGWGWNLSPGSITRVRNGIPDDLEETEVVQLNKTNTMRTVTTTLRGGAEIFERKDKQDNNETTPTQPKPISSVPSVGLSFTSVWNSITGFSFSAGINANYFGASGSLSFSSDGIGYNLGLDYFSMFSSGGGKIPKVRSLSFPGSVSGSIPFSRSRSIGFNNVEYENDNDKTFFTLLDYDTQFTIFSLAGVYVGQNASVLQIDAKDVVKHKASGYIFSGKRRRNNDTYELMDYTLEHDRPFRMGNKAGKDRPLPVNGADMYYVSGNGPSGTFRAFHSKALTYSPKRISNKIPGSYKHFSGILTSDLGAGFGLGNGGTTSKTMDYLSYNDPFANGAIGNTSTDAGYFHAGSSKDVDGQIHFRFINDPGQPIIQCNENQTSVGVKPYAVANGNGRMASATTISYKSNYQLGFDERKLAVSNDPSPRSNIADDSENSPSNSIIGSGGVQIGSSGVRADKRIGEFTVFDNGGTKYVYSLPVHSRKENELSFILNPDRVHYSEIEPVENRVIYSSGLALPNGNFDNLDGYSKVIGQVRNGTYASSYLPTMILSGDYADVDNNGLSPKDMGSYIHFTYRNKGYTKWRQPYAGFFLNNSRKNDGFDRLASVSYGETEIRYPATIKTKTHIAYFVTNKTNLSVTMSDNIVRFIGGSMNERMDAMPPVANESVAGASLTPPTIGPGNTNPKELLERIELYTIDENGKPIKLIKKVHFSYDYSLQQGAPGSAANNGKLTLLSVWDETMGTIPSHIAKYQFKYTYPQASTVNSQAPTVTGIPQKYINYYDDYKNLPNNTQNPNYSTEKVDRWGYYQSDGSRWNQRKLWNNQNPVLNGTTNPAANFDPAAWHLKNIITPSGSEIHVQFEQQDYTYVQDRRAMIMCKAKVATSGGYDLTDEDGNAYSNDLAGFYGKSLNFTGDEWLYCLWRFNSPDHQSTRDIGFYAKVSNSNQATPFWMNFSEGYTPLDVGEDFFGSYSPEGEYSSQNDDWWAVPALGSVISLAENMINALGQMNVHIVTQNNGFLYMRIPVALGKKGGGVRVKRLLFYSPQNALESNGADAVLYGQEYRYKVWDNTVGKLVSSGVATNEPDIGRFENSLVRLRDNKPDFFDNNKTIIYGEDLTELEGPLGEEYLPSPSIGYSNVIVTNINEGSSSGGFSQYQFYTAKDFPSVTVSRLSDQFQNDVPFTKASLSVLPSLGTSNDESYYGRTLYKIQRSQWHGVPKSVKHFGSIFSENDISELDLKTPNSSTEYEYFKDSEPKTVFYNIDRPFRKEFLGKTVEFISERKYSEESYISTTGEGSAALNTKTWTPDFGIGYSHMRRNERIRTEVEAIIVNNVPFVKKVVTTDNGAKSEAEYIAFDPNNAQPLVTKTKGYYSNASGHEMGNRGSVYTYSIPSYRVYPEMASKSAGEMKAITLKDDELGDVIIGASSGMLSFGFTANSHEKVNLLRELLGRNAVVEVFANENDNVGKVIKLTGTVGIGGSIISYNYQPVNSQNTPPSTIKKVLIHKAGFQNRSNEICQTISAYSLEDVITKGQEYAQRLFDIKEILNTINNEVLTYKGGWESLLSYNQDFVFSVNFPTTCNTYDIIKNQSIVYGVPTSNEEKIKFYHKTDGGVNKIKMGFTKKYSGNDIDYLTGDVFLFEEVNIIPGARLDINDNSQLQYTYLKNGVPELSFSGYNSIVTPLKVTTRCGRRVSNNPGGDCEDVTGCTLLMNKKVNALPEEAYNRVISASAVRYRTMPEYVSEPIMVSERECDASTLYNKQSLYFRPYETYSYHTSSTSSVTLPGLTNSAGKAYVSGTVSGFTPHDITTNYSSNSGWQKIQTTDVFSEHGIPVSTKDAFGISQTVRTDSWGRFIACEAANALTTCAGLSMSSEIYFQSFEKRTGIRTNPSWNHTNEIAHTGSQSLQLSANSTLSLDGCLAKAPNGTTREYLVSFWATDVSTNVQVASNNTITLLPGDAVASIVKLQPNSSRDKVQWKLFRTKITVNDASSTIGIINNSNNVIYVDDVKIQPEESVMTCYVYDNTSYLPMAVLDDNHFATEIQYDMRGVPVRTIQETYAGWKTVAENTVNTPKLARPSTGAPSPSMGGGEPIGLIKSGGKATDHYTHPMFYNNTIPDKRNSTSTPTPLGTGKVDMLQLNLTPDSKKIRLLGVDIDSTNKAQGNKPKTMNK